jgi:DNA-binding response OmpR family regulator
LEDDEDLKMTFEAFLNENGYDVMPVSNGVDGIRELMKAEFEAVICDMNMPTLPGDMFYLAVQRMRPALCDRFLFVSGQTDAKVADFITRVGGTILKKPFPVNLLLDMVGYVQVKSMLGVTAQG